MQAFATFGFFLESIITAGAGVYALLQPIDFLGVLIPPHLTSVLSGGNDVKQALAFAAHIYGLVLVLLGMAEGFLFLVRGQVQSKRALLWAMALADVIHVAVFWNAWMRDQRSGALILDPEAFKHWVAAWDTREWTAFHSNISLLAFYLPLRLVFIAVARDPSSKGTKGSKQQ